VNVAASVLSCLAADAVLQIQQSWVIAQHPVAGGQDGNGAERLQFPMTSIA